MARAGYVAVTGTATGSATALFTAASKTSYTGGKDPAGPNDPYSGDDGAPCGGILISNPTGEVLMVHIAPMHVQPNGDEEYVAIPGGTSETFIDRDTTGVAGGFITNAKAYWQDGTAPSPNNVGVGVVINN